jgi:formaldehyde-activating enzyme involved in methanogenesis
MGRYSAPTTKGTTSTTVGAAAVEAPAASMRRVKIYDLILGSEATPADNAFKCRLTRTTTASTGTAVTPAPLDPADAAAVTLVKENVTVEGTLGAELVEIPLNQRATFRWVAREGSEIVIPATANAGVLLQTPTAINTPALTATFLFEE